MSLASNVVGTIRNWWWFVIKGLLFIIAGAAILAKPAAGYASLSILFSLIILGIGITQLVFSISNKDWLPGWGWTLVSGIIDVVIGTYLLMFPIVTMATLPYFLGFWLMFRSFYLMGVSFDLRSLDVPNWGWILAGGVLLLILSLFVLYYPAAAALGIIAWSGAAFLMAGVISIMMAFQLRNIKKAAKSLV
jgi:uncharacterized membrane protein HdeD (DUF308 family)